MGWESHPQSRRRWIYSPLSSLHCSTHGYLVDPTGLEPANLLLAKQALSQLSYGPLIFWWRRRGSNPDLLVADQPCYHCHHVPVVEPKGFEPSTC